MHALSTMSNLPWPTYLTTNSVYFCVKDHNNFSFVCSMNYLDLRVRASFWMQLINYAGRKRTRKAFVDRNLKTWNAPPLGSATDLLTSTRSHEICKWYDISKQHDTYKILLVNDNLLNSYAISYSAFLLGCWNCKRIGKYLLRKIHFWKVVLLFQL